MRRETSGLSDGAVVAHRYTTPPDVSRARARFFHGHVGLLLYTERFHFYWRCGRLCLYRPHLPALTQTHDGDTREA
jgi:hypothetical protein